MKRKESPCGVNGFGTKVIMSTEGLVGLLEPASRFFDTDKMFQKGKTVEGTILTIKSEEGTDDRVYFPKRFSLPEEDAIRDQSVRYEQTRTIFPEPTGDIQGRDYRLEVLSGPHQGWTLQKNICV